MKTTRCSSRAELLLALAAYHEPGSAVRISHHLANDKFQSSIAFARELESRPSNEIRERARKILSKWGLKYEAGDPQDRRVSEESRLKRLIQFAQESITKEFSTNDKC